MFCCFRAPRQHYVDRKSMQPRAKRGFTPKQVQLLPRSDENVLRHVVCRFRIQHPPAQRVNARSVTPIQPLERDRITTRSKRGVKTVRIRTGRW
jgi:hypothetical protein